jgi:rRNA maturation RNase YbeY
LKNLSVNSSYKFIEKRKIHSLVSSLSQTLGFKIQSLEINFIGHKEILEINLAHLNHNYFTDIITFNYSGDQKLLDGEILISVDDAWENAKKYKVSVKEEIFRLVIHGILHLTGYDDTSTSKKRKMKLMENKLLNRNKFLLLRGS